jgi:transposase
LTFIRQAIALFCEQESPFSGVIELDESYFGTKRAKGKRGRGAADKTIVFGIYKRNGRVYTEIVPDVTKETLLQIVKGKVSLDSVIHTDGFRSYDGIVHLGYQKHYRILHSDGLFAVGSNHINGIEGFWGYAKVRLAKFRGLSKNSFYFHLKECEFRFNYRQENLYSLLLKISKDNGLI